LGVCVWKWLQCVCGGETRGERGNENGGGDENGMVVRRNGE